MTFFVPIKPSSGEDSSYNRAPALFFWTATPITWVWAFEKGFAPPNGVWPTMRFLVDGVAVTDWVSPTANSYAFTFDAADGHHIASAEPNDGFPSLWVLEKEFTVNTTGESLDNQASWVCQRRFEARFPFHPRMISRLVQYDGSIPTPKIYPLKPRGAEPYSVHLPMDKLWVRRLQSSAVGLVRRFVELPTGDTGIEADQKYFYSQAHGSTVKPPVITARDGPRGVGTLGYTYKFLMSPLDLGAYFCETNGRLGFLWLDGRITTIAGWRLKPGELKVHGGVLSSTYMYPKSQAEHLELYNSKWEVVGDWSRIADPQTFNEPWGFAGIGDGQDDGFHEFWVCDTISHRILYVNHYTAHSTNGYQQPRHAPMGYQAPGQPSGRAEIVTFLTGQNEFINEPWDCAINPSKEYLYWTNFVGNSICRARLDGSQPEVVIKCAKNPTQAQLGVTVRLGPGSKTAVTKANYLIDGPRGTATCVSPQALAFDSLGRLIWAERYTYCIRRFDYATGLVETVVQLPISGSGFSSSDPHDCAMAIDHEGSCGPKDDIFVTTWRGEFRYGADGTNRGKIAFSGSDPLMNGPLIDCSHPDYAWAIGVGKGRILYTGNASGSRIIEITKRQPTDPSANLTRYGAGWDAYDEHLQLTHGPRGQGELGYPYIEEMGSWQDAKIAAHARSFGMRDDQIEDFIYYVRYNNIDQDYSASPPPPPLPVDCVLSDWGAWTQVGDWSECVRGQQTRTERRSRMIVTEPANGGEVCGPLTEERNVSRGCSAPPLSMVVLVADVILNADGTYDISKK